MQKFNPISSVSRPSGTHLFHAPQELTLEHMNLQALDLPSLAALTSLTSLRLLGGKLGGQAERQPKLAGSTSIGTISTSGCSSSLMAVRLPDRLRCLEIENCHVGPARGGLQALLKVLPASLTALRVTHAQLALNLPKSILLPKLESLDLSFNRIGSV